jgi:type II restriction/modification system DNA methylase subunit YeeA
MSQPDGDFGEHTIRYFNGGLFDSSSIIEMDTTDLGILYEVSRNYNWAHIAPEIFGTLFERSLNAERRSLIGAHYTSAEDILLLVEPVVMLPLEQRWADVRRNVLESLESGRASQSRKTLFNSSPKAETLLAAWIDELTGIRVLDPACGSGNFLYLALRRILDLWLEAQRFAAQHDISLVLPRMVSPSQLFGIETEFYAHELASIVVWIGFLQWTHEHGITDDREPILQKLESIEHADAIMRYDAEGKPYEPTWPVADFIIGNPPFLGGKLLRRELGDRYVDSLFALYKGRVKAESDLVVYWFEKARHPGNPRRRKSRSPRTHSADRPDLLGLV